MWSEETSGSASAQNGAEPAASGPSIGRANGMPPSGRPADSSQSHSSAARAKTAGPHSSNTSKASSAPTGWLRADRRSGSRAQP